MASNCPTNVTATPRGTGSSYEGVGSRVVRGPDWKWGRQVRASLQIFILDFV